MNTLKMAAVNAVKDGVTTIAEMVKATYEAEEVIQDLRQQIHQLLLEYQFLPE